jgi:hypothetical protein
MKFKVGVIQHPSPSIPLPEVEGSRTRRFISFYSLLPPGNAVNLRKKEQKCKIKAEEVPQIGNLKSP